MFEDHSLEHLIENVVVEVIVGVGKDEGTQLKMERAAGPALASYVDRQQQE
jgi:hypothetical protein